MSAEMPLIDDNSGPIESVRNERPAGAGYPRLATEAKANSDGHGIVYQTSWMRKLVEMGKKFARSSASVLISGESGTGKELFARLIHDQSPRANEKFVSVNCAALSENLLESEFFGHARGAYTGADQERMGRFEWANGGTILLDEVTEIPVRLQAKLLRVLEENVFQRVGSNENTHIDVRVVATSNRDLQKAVNENAFRLDLYHRLNVLQLEIPPLRKRREDIAVLAKKFIDEFSNESEEGVDSLAPEALKKLQQFTWPGNVRQLRNSIHRACVLATGTSLQADQFEAGDSSSDTVPEWLLDLPMDEVERHMILNNLDRFGGNKTATANHLGVTPRTLHTKVKSYLAKQLLENE